MNKYTKCNMKNAAQQEDKRRSRAMAGASICVPPMLHTGLCGGRCSFHPGLLDRTHFQAKTIKTIQAFHQHLNGAARSDSHLSSI